MNFKLFNNHFETGSPASHRSCIVTAPFITPLNLLHTKSVACRSIVAHLFTIKVRIAGGQTHTRRSHSKKPQTMKKTYARIPGENTPLNAMDTSEETVSVPVRPSSPRVLARLTDDAGEPMRERKLANENPTGKEVSEDTAESVCGKAMESTPEE